MADPLNIPDTPPHSSGAAFFDIDRTLVAGAAALRPAGSFRRQGLLTRRQQVRAAITQLAFAVRGADDDGIERFKATAKELIAGWDQQEVRDIVARELDRHVHPIVYREALDRIELHHSQGQSVFAVSATMREIAEPLADLLGLDGTVATEMEIVDGMFTGDVKIGCFGATKAEQLVAFAAERGIDLAASTAYSDSISDEPFLRSVGRPYAVNPDKELRKLAEEEGWGILAFRTRVQIPLHQRKSTRISAVVALFSAVMFSRSRRRRRAG